MWAAGSTRPEEVTAGAGVKRPRVLEMELIKEEMRRELLGLILPAVVMGAQLFLPQRRACFLPNLLTLLAIICCQLCTAWVLHRERTYGNLKHMHVFNDMFHHTARATCHLLWIIVNERDLLSRLIFLFGAPCDAARMSRHTPFIFYMVTHVILLFYRFAGSYIDELPFLIVGVACSHTLYETSVMKQRTEEISLEKSKHMVILMQDTALDVLHCFCDATARISSSMEFLNTSQSLSTLLNRRIVAGRSFTDIMHMGDRDGYRDFVQNFEVSSEESGSCVPGADKKGFVKRMRLQSYDLHLEDGMSIPVGVHAFHARMESLDEESIYLVGIVEQESHQLSKRRQSKSPRERSRSVPREQRLNFDSGKLEPSGPAFSDRDVDVIADREALKKIPEADQGARAKTRAESRWRLRPSSPRPERGTGLTRRVPGGSTTPAAA